MRGKEDAPFPVSFRTLKTEHRTRRAFGPGYWIEIKQGATITKAKYKIEGNNVTEQPWARKIILTVTDDFSGYEKGTPATIDIYLTETATKAVATATVKVIDMPFKLVFFKTDHLGTPRVITDQDGKVLSNHDYLAYGEELTDPEFTTNNMKFTGHERDPETGLDYMLARHYTSGSGRFLQVDPGYDYDPMDPMSFNLYGYVRGNPIMGTDPTGMVLITGEIDRMKEIAGDDADLVHDNNHDGKVDEIVATKDQLANNEGLNLLNDLVSSDNVYVYQESSGVYTGETQNLPYVGKSSIPRPVEGGVENLDPYKDWRINGGKAKKPYQKPPKGVNDMVVIDPTIKHYTSYPNLGSKQASTTGKNAFHELAEAYAKIDQTQKYLPRGGETPDRRSAHNTAIRRELKWMKQQGKVWPCGGGPPWMPFLKD